MAPLTEVRPPHRHRRGTRPHRPTGPARRAPAGRVAPAPAPTAPDRRAAAAVRRAADVILAAAGLVVLSPLLVAAAVAIVVTDGRPVLFRQRRVGRHGKPFTMIKLRTMVVDAEQRRADLAPVNECDGPLFKVRCDPRVTPVGRALRDTSLDEVPQLWNVLVGHMSLVGPRPALPAEVAAFDDEHRRRHAVRPGITGAWQAFARTDRSFERYRQLDLWYLEHRSLRLDARIVGRTAGQTVHSLARAVRPAPAPEPVGLAVERTEP